MRGEIKLGELIALVRDKAERDAPYEVYATDADYDSFTAATPVYVASPPDLDPDYAVEPILPPEVAARHMWTFCSDFLLQDVVDNALMQNGDVTVDEIVIGLEHYLVHYAYMDYVDGKPTGQGGRAIWGGGKHGRVGRLDPAGKPKPPRS